MWYVNGGASFEGGNNEYSFILTMWYVNLAFDELDKVVNESFILTMWYVNFFSKVKIFSELTKFYINYVVCK